MPGGGGCDHYMDSRHLGRFSPAPNVEHREVACNEQVKLGEKWLTLQYISGIICVPPRRWVAQVATHVISSQVPGEHCQAPSTRCEVNTVHVNMTDEQRSTNKY